MSDKPESAANLGYLASSLSSRTRYAWVHLYERAEKAGCLASFGAELLKYNLESDARQYLPPSALREIGFKPKVPT